MMRYLAVLFLVLASSVQAAPSVFDTSKLILRAPMQMEWRTAALKSAFAAPSSVDVGLAQIGTKYGVGSSVYAHASAARAAVGAGAATLSSSAPLVSGLTGQRATVALARTLTPATLAKAAVPILKRAGPIAAGVLTLAPLIWDGDEWMHPGAVEEQPSPDNFLPVFTGNSWKVSGCSACGTFSTLTACIANRVGTKCGPLNISYPVSSTHYKFSFRYGACPDGNVNATCESPKGDESCPAGRVRVGDHCLNPSAPIAATDDDIRGHAEDEIRAKNNGDAVAPHVSDDLSPTDADPQSVGGDTSTAPHVKTTKKTDASGTTTKTTTTTNVIDHANGSGTGLQPSTVTVTTTIHNHYNYPDGSDGDDEDELGPEDPPPEPEGGEIRFGDPVPDDVTIPETTITADFAPEMSAAGSCPASPSTSVLGRQVTFSWQPTCDFASGMRPIVILGSALFAGIWIFGVLRS
jgi:hypothetical protein